MSKILFFFSGFLFSIGLGMSGMTDPKKVKGFLDVFSDWNPTLIFVMVGAIAVHSLVYFFIIKMKAPIFSSEFSIPSKRKIDLNIIGGSTIFGVGWGLSGYCPGPVIASIGIMSNQVLVFSFSMLTGFFLFHHVYKKIKGDV